MQELTDDLIKAFWEDNPVLMIHCFKDADGEMRGFTDRDQANLDMYNAVKDLPGFDGKGPLILIRPDLGEENEKSR